MSSLANFPYNSILAACASASRYARRLTTDPRSFFEGADDVFQFTANDAEVPWSIYRQHDPLAADPIDDQLDGLALSCDYPLTPPAGAKLVPKL